MILVLDLKPRQDIISPHPFSVTAYPALRIARVLEPIPVVKGLRYCTIWTSDPF